MRLLTHNLLACHSRHCTQTSNNFPLQFKEVKLEWIETDYNEVFLRGFLPKLDWNALVKTSKELGQTTLPDQGPDPQDEMVDEELLKNLHHILMELHIVEGSMICPNCSHDYPIKNGIPNMLLAEHEIAR